MKKLTLLTAVLTMFFLSSCRDIINTVLDALPPFDVPFSTSVQVPFATVSTTTYTRSPEIPMNLDLDAKIKQNDPKYSINNLKSVKLSNLTLVYVSSQLGNKLDVIKNARIYVKSPGKTERLIASAYNNTNPDGISFNVEDSELLEYFRTTENSLIIEIQGSRVTADQIKMTINSGFKIKVQL